MGCGEASLEEIEEHNILVASQIAMARALKGLGDVAGVILVDGLPAKHLGKEHVAVVGGRNLSIDCCGFCGCKKFHETEPFYNLVSYIPCMVFRRTVDTARRSIFRLSVFTDLVRSIGDRFYPWDQQPCPAWKNSREAGRYGERVAARFLQREGVKILVRNYRARCGEIDLMGREEMSWSS